MGVTPEGPGFHFLREKAEHKSQSQYALERPGEKGQGQVHAQKKRWKAKRRRRNQSDIKFVALEAQTNMATGQSMRV